MSHDQLGSLGAGFLIDPSKLLIFPKNCCCEPISEPRAFFVDADASENARCIFEKYHPPGHFAFCPNQEFHLRDILEVRLDEGNEDPIVELVFISGEIKCLRFWYYHTDQIKDWAKTLQRAVEAYALHSVDPQSPVHTPNPENEEQEISHASAPTSPNNDQTTAPPEHDPMHPPREEFFTSVFEGNAASEPKALFVGGPHDFPWLTTKTDDSTKVNKECEKALPSYDDLRKLEQEISNMPKSEVSDNDRTLNSQVSDNDRTPVRDSDINSISGPITDQYANFETSCTQLYWNEPTTQFSYRENSGGQKKPLFLATTESVHSTASGQNGQTANEQLATYTSEIDSYIYRNVIKRLDCIDEKLKRQATEMQQIVALKKQQIQLEARLHAFIERTNAQLGRHEHLSKNMGMGSSNLERRLEKVCIIMATTMIAIVSIFFGMVIHAKNSGAFRSTF